MIIRVGTAPDSWGVWFASDPKQTPWNRYLDEVAEAGYEWTELGPYGYLPADPATLRRELATRNLRVCGGAVVANLEESSASPIVERQVLDAGELTAALGGEYFVLIDDLYSNLFTGEMTAPRRLDDQAWKTLVSTVQRVAEMVRQRFGLGTVFHPHAETHVEYEEQIEALLDQTDPKYVGLCLDTGHHAYRGGDPVAFIRLHHERIPYLHVKSVDRQKQKQVEQDKIPFALAVAMGVFCEPSLGAVDFLALRDVLREIDYKGYAIVEQDMYPAPFDQPLPIASRSRAYLQEIGIGS